MAESVARLCPVPPVEHMADFLGLSWSPVKAIDKRQLEERLGPVDLSDLRVIARNEVAIRKGRRYATVVVEPYVTRVLWVGRGRTVPWPAAEA